MSTSNGAKSPTNDKDEVEDDPGLIQYLKPDTQQAKLLPKQNFSDAAVTIESVDQNHKEREGDGNLAHKWNSHFMAGHNELMKSFIAGHDKRMQMFHSVFEQVGGHKPNDHSNKDPQFLKADIMCLVWKRRDGLAKLSNSWERRLIALVGHDLLYYNVDDDFILDCEKCPPIDAIRGKFNLAKTHLQIYVTSDKMSPTPYCLSIKLAKSDPSINRGWKLCFDDTDKQMKWLMAISKVIVQKTPKAFKRSDTNRDQNVRDHESPIADEITPLIAKKQQHEQLTDMTTISRKRLCLAGKYLFLTIAAFNIAFLIGNTWAVIIIDFFLLKIVERVPLEVRTRKLDISQSEPEKSKIKMKHAPASDGFVPGFSTIKSGTEEAKLSLLPKWQVPRQSLMVRSQTYFKDKKKYSSLSPLYDVVQCDMLITSQPEHNFSKRVNLSKLDITEPNGFDHIPDVLVISLCLPVDAPKISFGSSSDPSRSYTCMFYFRLSDETLKLLNDPGIEHEARSALNVWQSWCKCAQNPTSEENKKMLSRFKLIPLVLNSDECGLPSSMSGYNNKPMLVKRIGTTGLIHHHLINLNDSKSLHCMEFNINFHEFPFIAKQAFSYLLQNVVLNCEAILGFVIEARDDDELPEVVCGMGQICRPDILSLQEIS